ncbi:restriction endonuclease [Streptomyces brevispora]|nr:restriction endonuclease [Streptomyces brevispora]
MSERHCNGRGRIPPRDSTTPDTSTLRDQKNSDLQTRDYEQIALQVTGHACAVVTEVRRHAAIRPKSDGRGALAEVVLREADGHLSAPLEGTARCAQNLARLVWALYRWMDHLTEPARAAT